MFSQNCIKLIIPSRSIPKQFPLALNLRIIITFSVALLIKLNNLRNCYNFPIFFSFHLYSNISQQTNQPSNQWYIERNRKHHSWRLFVLASEYLSVFYGIFLLLDVFFFVFVGYEHTSFLRCRPLKRCISVPMLYEWACPCHCLLLNFSLLLLPFFFLFLFMHLAKKEEILSLLYNPHIYKRGWYKRNNNYVRMFMVLYMYTANTFFLSPSFFLIFLTSLYIRLFSFEKRRYYQH